MITVRPFAAIGLLSLATVAHGQTGAVQAAPVVSPPVPTAPNRIVVPDRTPIQLMVLREISGNTAKPGDRFKLRVNAPVVVNGVTVVPVGSMATGEVLAAGKNGGAGGSGRINARLVSLDTVSGSIPLSGEQGNVGDSNVAGVVLGVASFGLLGLLSRGNDARLKAGAIINGYIGGAFEFDPATRSLTPTSAAPPAPMVVGVAPQ